jgi:hypothetical protein
MNHCNRSTPIQEYRTSDVGYAFEGRPVLSHHPDLDIDI